MGNRFYREYSPEETKVRRDHKNRNRSLVRNYNITIEEYNSMFAEQSGRCAICDKHQTELKQQLFVDHNHSTGKIRSLLCTRCNYVVGALETNIAPLADSYIREHSL